MADIRNGLANDPVLETRLDDPNSTLRASKPEGMTIELDDEGNAVAHFNSADEEERGGDFFDNLAEDMDEQRLNTIALDLIEAVENDIQAHDRRQEQYRLGLQRTGLGDEVTAGAPFPGASKVVHPMLTEAVVDYSARVTNELLPPEGPVKPYVIGEVTQDKQDRADRIAKHMNWQLTEQLLSAYSELEQGFTQQPLEGAFYSKMYAQDGRVDVMIVTGDKVHRPWNNGDFYIQPRITHDMDIDKWTFQENVRSGLWRDIIDPNSSSDNIDETTPQSANDRIIGRDLPPDNIDENRRVFDISTKLALKDPDDEVLPYIVTIDVDTQKVLSIYRNWDEDDANKLRQDFLIEWPFWPWVGGYAIGLGHMIGGLSGAASGALRALLDAALLNSVQTGVKLKGGVTQGGQNLSVSPGQTREMAGTLAQDDIRKTYMPLPFPEPSPTLFQLLGFLVDSGKSVIRTTFDEFTNMTGQTPVGTANMMVEQGLKTFGAVFGRQHKAMKRFLRQLYKLNQKTISDEVIMDEFGEPLVYKEDYDGPMCIVPISDPKIFSDTQRMAQGQLVSGRAQLYQAAGVPIYKVRDAELFLLRAAKVPSPEQFLVDSPQPQQLNPVAENVAASKGLPIAAYPGQDHEAHIAVHAAYIQNPIFASNPTIALKALPPLIQHLADHITLWYSDAMLMATNAMLEKTFKDPRITLDTLQTVKGLEAPLDRLMAELTPDVMHHAQDELGSVMQIIQQAQQIIQKLQPPQPMDPSIVAMKDVERQTNKDQADIQLKAGDLKQKQAEGAAKLAANAQQEQAKNALTDKGQDQNAGLEQQRIDIERQSQLGDMAATHADHTVKAEKNQIDREATHVAAATDMHKIATDKEVKLEQADKQQETQMHANALQAQTDRENARLQAETQKTMAREGHVVSMAMNTENNDAKSSINADNNKSKEGIAKSKPKPGSQKPKKV